jgi:hypothetical protein
MDRMTAWIVQVGDDPLASVPGMLPSTSVTPVLSWLSLTHDRLDRPSGSGDRLSLEKIHPGHLG